MNIDIQRVRFEWLPALKIDLAETDAPADKSGSHLEHTDRRLTEREQRSKKRWSDGTIGIDGCRDGQVEELERDESWSD